MNILSLGADAPVTMTSREIAELTGKEHKNVLADIRGMLDGLGQASADFSADLPDGLGRLQPAFRLPKRETLILVSGYSVAMRAKIIDRWQELEAGAPKPVALTTLEILSLAMESEKGRLLALEQRDHAIATKAQIGSRREASAMATASAAKREVSRLKAELGRHQTHATIVAVEKATGQQFHWLPLRRWCTEHNIQPASVPDPRYGEVKAWPADAWGDVFGVDLQELFPV